MAQKTSPKISKKDIPTLNLVTDRDIAEDFAQKVYQKFDKLVKSIVLFGSTTKGTATSGSDIDIIILVDDASVKFDQELIGWYRGELEKIISANPYKKELHINTIKLTTWWNDLMKGDPVVINVIRYGEEILDFGGFFRPLRILLQEGRIRSTPEAIYTALERAPMHLVRSMQAEMSSVEGLYWAMVDSAHALLMAAHITPPSPEQIPELLRKHFVIKKILDDKYVVWYAEIFKIHKDIMHGKVRNISGQNLDALQKKAEDFVGAMAGLITRMVA